MKANLSDEINEKLTGTKNWEDSDIVFADNLKELLSKRFSDYAIHILCDKGNYSFKMLDKTFRVTDTDLS